MTRRTSTGAVVTAVVLLVLALVGGCAAVRGAAHYVTFRVRHLDDQATRNGHKYLVFTDHGVYEDADTIVFFKYDSSDLFNQLQPGGEYRCKVLGVRIPLFSSYPNLISCKAVTG